MTKVFISYSHDSAEHSERVLQFSNALRSHGIDAELDRYHVRPPKGWPHWCEEQLRPENSEFVLMVCTETYLKRIQDKVPADEGRGVFWEGGIIYDYLYDGKGNKRFVPVLFANGQTDFIPPPIRNHTRYCIQAFELTDVGYQSLYRELTGQPLVTKPPLGNKIRLEIALEIASRPLKSLPAKNIFPTPDSPSSAQTNARPNKPKPGVGSGGKMKPRVVHRPRVYISYSSRTKGLQQSALSLANKLRSAGIDSRIDLYYGRSLHGFTPPSPSAGRDAWDYWQEEQVKLADRIIVFCTAEYAASPPKSGVARDIRYMKSELRSSAHNVQKLIPVGLGPYEDNARFIPSFMKGANYYDLASPQRGLFGLADLIRRLKIEFPVVQQHPVGTTRRPKGSRPGRSKGVAPMPNPPLRAADLKGKIHAAIITIRPDEYEAMESKLGAVHSVTGNNTYKYVQLFPESGESISVVLTRVVNQGNARAQAVATNIIHDLDPAWIILVGIAGGVPDNEFSLGDVVLATYLNDFSFSAASDGRRTYQAGGGSMHRDVERFLSTRTVGIDGKKLLKLAGFNDDPTLLVHPEVFPKEIPNRKRYYGSESHQQKVTSTIEKRFPKGKRHGGPIAWQGPCANGNILVKDAELLKHWQDSARQIVNVETELGGVYEAARTAGRENYPVLAIRGLSDIVGFTRDANWTGYACKTAAAYTYAVLQSGFIDFAKNLPQNP